MVSVGGRPGATRADGPDAGGAVVGCPGSAVADTKVQARRAAGRSPATPVAVVRAGVGQRDGEGDGVADVGRRVAHRLGQRQVGLLRASRWRWRVLLAGFGSNWSAPVTVAVLVAGVRADDRGQRSAASAATAGVDGADVPDAGRRVVGALAGRRRLTKVSPAGSRSVTCTLVAASGPLLVRVTVKVIVVADVGRRRRSPSWSGDRSACCGVSVALARVVGRVRVELVGAADRRRVGPARRG